MITNNFKVLLATAMVGGAVAFSSAALAVPTLTLIDGNGNSISLTDNTAAPTINGAVSQSSPFLPLRDLDLRDGVVRFEGIIGNWELNVSTGQTDPFLGGPNFSQIKLGTENTSLSSVPESMTMIWSDDDFARNGRMTNSVGGVTASGTVEFATYVDAGNNIIDDPTAIPGTATKVFSHTALAGGSGTDASVSLPASISGPYSITQVATISHNPSVARQASSFNFTTTVPEPATLMLLGAGLLGIGAATRRRRTQA